MTTTVSTDLGLFIIRGEWDDLPALLTRLEIPFQELGDSVAVCETSHVLNGCAALYVGCGAEIEASEKALANLRQFINQGGGMYVSDLAAPLIDRLFPGKVEFSKVDYQSDNPVQIVDPGLAELLGETLSLHMDYESAQGIQSVADDVRVLIQGRRAGSAETLYPYLVTFGCGQGQILYTVFHNAQQTNASEEELLRYLIFRPMLTRARNRVRQALQSRGVEAVKEIFAGANVGQVSPAYSWEIHRHKAVFALAWEGRAAFGLQINDPAGRRVRYVSTDESPLVVELPIQTPGAWTCRVKAVTQPLPLYPYVLSGG